MSSFSSSSDAVLALASQLCKFYERYLRCGKYFSLIVLLRVLGSSFFTASCLSKNRAGQSTICICHLAMQPHPLLHYGTKCTDGCCRCCTGIVTVHAVRHFSNFLLPGCGSCCQLAMTVLLLRIKLHVLTTLYFLTLNWLFTYVFRNLSTIQPYCLCTEQHISACLEARHPILILKYVLLLLLLTLWRVRNKIHLPRKKFLLTATCDVTADDVAFPNAISTFQGRPTYKDANRTLETSQHAGNRRKSYKIMIMRMFAA